MTTTQRKNMMAEKNYRHQSNPIKACRNCTSSHSPGWKRGNHEDCIFSGDDHRSGSPYFANKKGRGRGMVKNGEIKRTKSKTWGGNLLSTGEKTISEVSTKGGIEARIVEINRPKP